MRRFVLLLSALMTIAANSSAQTSDTSVTLKRRGTGMEVRQYTLRTIDTREAVSLLMPFVPFGNGGGVWASGESVISVVGVKRTLAVADSVLQSYDHAPATLVLQFMLIAASDSAVNDPRIGEVDRELRRLLRFNGYRRLVEATSVVSERNRFTSTMSTADLGEFTVSGTVKSVSDGRVGVAIGLHGGTTGVMMGVSVSPNVRELLSTSLTVPLGQTVVLGTAAGEKGVAALILTVRPELASTSPPDANANPAARAVTTVNNPPPADTGAYPFRVRYGSAGFDGTLHLFADSITVESKDAQCLPVPRVRTFKWEGTFSCLGIATLDEVALRFDRWNPKERSYWTGSFTKLQNVGSECVMYTTNPQGKSVCARWQPKMEERRIKVGDRILFLSQSR